MTTMAVMLETFLRCLEVPGLRWFAFVPVFLMSLISVLGFAIFLLVVCIDPVCRRIGKLARG